jgi:hypothetical protein
LKAITQSVSLGTDIFADWQNDTVPKVVFDWEHCTEYIRKSYPIY